VVAEFDGGAVTSDAGGLLLGAADKAIDLVRRLAGCFRDARDRRFIEHAVATLSGSLIIPKPLWRHQRRATNAAPAVMPAKPRSLNSS
jgi:Transposase DDE domain group 1